ncbi:MAG: MMPL family transporter [Spirochaetaceae bacterium]|nr:MMPL family transporter [Spirochaetaceae bacterium]
MEKFFKRPKVIVLVIAVITVFFAAQLPKAELDNNNLNMIPKNDPARITSDYIDETFGSSLFVMVGLERKYGTVFDAEFLERIGDFVDRVSEIPVVDAGGVSSIITVDYISADGDSIVVDKLVGDDFSGTPEEIGILKQKLLSWDLYRGSFFSDDFSATQVIVPLNVMLEDAGGVVATENATKIRDIAQEMFAGLAEVYVAGVPVLSGTVNEAIGADIIMLVPLVIVIVLGVLFFSFRCISGVVLPLLTVLIATIWSLGAMPFFGVKLTIVSALLPVILVAVGSAYGIHVVTHYRSHINSGEPLDRERHREIVYALVRKIRKPVFLAALTTLAGFMSLCFTTLAPIRHFGLFSGFGVMAAFAISLTLIPALFLIRGPKPPRLSATGQPARAGHPRKDAAADGLDRGIAGVFYAVSRRRFLVLGAAAIIVLIGIYGMSRIIVDNVMVEMFRADSDVAKSDRFVREKFGGSKVVSVVMQADSAETLLHPASLGAMDNLNTYLSEKVPGVGKVMGFTDMIKRINQLFNADESPEGLRAGENINSEAGFGDDAGGFGFGDDAGGFGDFGFEGGEEGGAAPAGGQSGDSYRPQAEELIALLDKASGESGEARAFVGELKKLVNYQGASYYEVPQSPGRYGKQRPEELQVLVSNYLVLLSGDIGEYANDPLEPTAIKTTVQFRTAGQDETDAAVGEIYNYIEANFPDNVKTLVGGSALIEGSVNTQIVRSQLISVFVSIVIVFLIVAFSNRSVIAGLIGSLPLSVSILIDFAVMGFTGIKLNLGTAMVASLSIGIGIDYTIHFIEAYKREYRAAEGRGDFLRNAFATSGKAILINAASVGFGFAVLALSRFTILAELGVLIALTMLTSAMVSLTVVPVLLTLIKPKFIYRGV